MPRSSALGQHALSVVSVGLASSGLASSGLASTTGFGAMFLKLSIVEFRKPVRRRERLRQDGYAGTKGAPSSTLYLRLESANLARLCRCLRPVYIGDLFIFGLTPNRQCPNWQWSSRSPHQVSAPSINLLTLADLCVVIEAPDRAENSSELNCISCRDRSPNGRAWPVCRCGSAKSSSRLWCAVTDGRQTMRRLLILGGVARNTVSSSGSMSLK